MTPQEKGRRAVRTAIETGVMVVPSCCSKCGDYPGRGRDGRRLLQAHHHQGYDYPLDVTWLCVSCHRAETPQGICLGTSNANSRLTDTDILEIHRCPNIHREELARRFGISKWTITDIRSGRRWGWLRALSKGSDHD